MAFLPIWFARRANFCDTPIARICTGTRIRNTHFYTSTHNDVTDTECSQIIPTTNKKSTPLLFTTRVQVHIREKWRGDNRTLPTSFIKMNSNVKKISYFDMIAIWHQIKCETVQIFFINFRIHYLWVLPVVWINTLYILGKYDCIRSDPLSSIT